MYVCTLPHKRESFSTFFFALYNNPFYTKYKVIKSSITFYHESSPTSLQNYHRNINKFLK